MSFRKSIDYLAMQSASAKLKKMIIVHPSVSRDQIDCAFNEIRAKDFSVADLEENTAMHRVLCCRIFGEAFKGVFPSSLYDIYFDTRTTARSRMSSEPWLEKLLTIEECREIVKRVTGRSRNVISYIKSNTLPAYRFSAKTIRVSYPDLVKFIQEVL